MFQQTAEKHFVQLQHIFLSIRKILQWFERLCLPFYGSITQGTMVILYQLVHLNPSHWLSSHIAEVNVRVSHFQGSDFHTSYLLLFPKFLRVSILYMIFCTYSFILTMPLSFPCSIYHTAFIQGLKICILLYPRLILDEFH